MLRLWGGYETGPLRLRFFARAARHAIRRNSYFFFPVRSSTVRFSNS